VESGESEVDGVPCRYQLRNEKEVVFASGAQLTRVRETHTVVISVSKVTVGLQTEKKVVHAYVVEVEISCPSRPGGRRSSRHVTQEPWVGLSYPPLCGLLIEDCPVWKIHIGPITDPGRSSALADFLPVVSGMRLLFGAAIAAVQVLRPEQQVSEAKQTSP